MAESLSAGFLQGFNAMDKFYARQHQQEMDKKRNDREEKRFENEQFLFEFEKSLMPFKKKAAELNVEGLEFNLVKGKEELKGIQSSNELKNIELNLAKTYGDKIKKAELQFKKSQAANNWSNAQYKNTLRNYTIVQKNKLVNDIKKAEEIDLMHTLKNKYGDDIPVQMLDDLYKQGKISDRWYNPKDGFGTAVKQQRLISEAFQDPNILETSESHRDAIKTWQSSAFNSIKGEQKENGDTVVGTQDQEFFFTNGGKTMRLKAKIKYKKPNGETYYEEGWVTQNRIINDPDGEADIPVAEFMEKAKTEQTWLKDLVGQEKYDGLWNNINTRLTNDDIKEGVVAKPTAGGVGRWTDQQKEAARRLRALEQQKNSILTERNSFDESPYAPEVQQAMIAAIDQEYSALMSQFPSVAQTRGRQGQRGGQGGGYLMGGENGELANVPRSNASWDELIEIGKRTKFRTPEQMRAFWNAVNSKAGDPSDHMWFLKAQAQGDIQQFDQDAIYQNIMAGDQGLLNRSRDDYINSGNGSNSYQYSR